MGYARKDLEKTKKIAKKFVRYQEGAELYSIGLTKFVIIPLQFLYFRDTKSKLFSFILYFPGGTPYFCLNALIKWLQSQNPVSWLI